MATRGTLLVNPATGAIVAPTTATTFRNANGLQIGLNIQAWSASLDSAATHISWSGSIPTFASEIVVTSSITTTTGNVIVPSGDVITGGGVFADTLSVDAITATGDVVLTGTFDFSGATGTLGYGQGGTNAASQSAARVNLGGAKGFASSGALQAGTPDYAGQLCFVTGSFAWSVATGTGAGDTDGDTVCLNNRVYFTNLTTTVGSVLSGSNTITATGVGALNVIQATGGTFIDNSLNLLNDSGGYAGFTAWKPSGAIGDEGFAFAIGPTGGNLYEDTAFIATNAPLSSPTDDPWDILFSQEKSDGAPSNQHARLRIAYNGITLYGVTAGANTGNVGLFVNTSGNVGIRTNSLTAGAELTVNGDAEFTGQITSTGGVAGLMLHARAGGTGMQLFSPSNTRLDVYDNANGAVALTLISDTQLSSPYANTKLGTTTNPWADLCLSKTITAGGTTGAQTINKASGSVNLAASATSLVVTNSLVTTNSRIFLNIATNDASSFELRAVAASGSFTIHVKGTAPAAETRVDFLVLN